MQMKNWNVDPRGGGAGPCPTARCLGMLRDGSITERGQQWGAGDASAVVSRCAGRQLGIGTCLLQEAVSRSLCCRWIKVQENPCLTKVWDLTQFPACYGRLGSAGLGHLLPGHGSLLALPSSAVQVTSPPLNINPERGKIMFILFSVCPVTHTGSQHGCYEHEAWPAQPGFEPYFLEAGAAFVSHHARFHKPAREFLSLSAS